MRDRADYHGSYPATIARSYRLGIIYLALKNLDHAAGIGGLSNA